MSGRTVGGCVQVAWVWFGFGLGVARAQSAGEVLDLGGALTYAAEHNLALGAEARRVEASEGASALAVAELAPTAGIDASWVVGSTSQPLSSSSSSSSSPAGYGRAIATARADVPLVDASAWASVRSARLGVDAAHRFADAVLQDVLALVGLRYVELVRAEQVVVEAEALLARSVRLAELASNRVEVGAAAPIEATRASLLVRQDEQRVVGARADRDAARMRLVEALGMPLDAGIAVAGGQVTEPPAGAVDRPDLAALRATAASVEAERAAVLRGAVPRLSAFGAVGGVVDADGSGPVAAVGVELGVDLFSGTARSAAARIARANADALGVDALDLERRIAVEVAVADAAVATGAEQWSIARDARALSEREVALAEDRFATGTAPNVEVVDAQVRLAGAVFAEVDALAGYNLALLDAWRSRGRLAELAAPPR